MAKLLLTVLLATMLAAASTACFAVPSTDGWTMAFSVDGNSVDLTVAVDNLDELLTCTSLVEKTWENVALGDTGATLKMLKIGIDGDPVVNLNFEVTAGAFLTNFTVTAANIAFAPINAEGTASASVTVTDGDDVGNGATATGLYTGGKCYLARYNSPGNTPFAYLVSSPVVAPPDSTVQNGETKPPWTAMGTVYDISSQFQFSLTPNDLASGTSSFRIRPIPEPGSMLALLSGLIGCAGLALRRKRA